MESQRDRIAVKQGIRLLIAKVILGAVAAGLAMLLMRAVGIGEIAVALLIGIVPGVTERSLKKFLAGVVLALIGYMVGAMAGLNIAKIMSGVPLGHWAVTGAFIGLTAGISGKPGQWFSFRVIVWTLGALYGFVFGLVFGVLGDIGGFLITQAPAMPLFYYSREVSLLCAGVFINFGVALATIAAASVDNGLWRVARIVERVEA